MLLILGGFGLVIIIFDVVSTRWCLPPLSQPNHPVYNGKRARGYSAAAWVCSGA
jgi:hypothetical protein